MKKGQLLFTLDKRKYEAEVQSAKAQVAKAQADLEFAREKVTVDTAKAKLDSGQSSAAESGSGRESSHSPWLKEKAVPQQDLDNALVGARSGQSKRRCRPSQL